MKNSGIEDEKYYRVNNNKNVKSFWQGKIDEHRIFIGVKVEANIIFYSFNPSWKRNYLFSRKFSLEPLPLINCVKKEGP